MVCRWNFLSNYRSRSLRPNIYYFHQKWRRKLQENNFTRDFCSSTKENSDKSHPEDNTGSWWSYRILQYIKIYYAHRSSFPGKSEESSKSRHFLSGRNWMNKNMMCTSEMVPILYKFSHRYVLRKKTSVGPPITPVAGAPCSSC